MCMQSNTVSNNIKWNLSNMQFRGGDRFEDKRTGKLGTVSYLRNDSIENENRRRDPSHYYYHVDFDDKTFETYMYQNNMVKTDKQLQKPSIVLQKFFEGDRFQHKHTKKFGTVRRLRDDAYEKERRKSDPSHYYYHVDFDDTTFETYLYQDNMVKPDEQPQKPTIVFQKFNEGDRFQNKINGKIGTVLKLRNDSFEKESRKSNPSHYYYHVDFDDNTFETYLYQDDMVKTYQQPKRVENVFQKFYEGDRFQDKNTKKLGTVVMLRDDAYDKILRKDDPQHFYYVVNFDDNTFARYFYQDDMIKNYDSYDYQIDPSVYEPKTRLF